MSKPTDATQFTLESAERIARVVRAAELGSPQARALTFDRIDAQRKEKVFRVATFTGSWAINSAKTVTFRNVTSTPNTVSASNILLALPDRGSQPCGIAKDGTAWYLIAFTPVTQATAATTVLTSVSLGTAGLRFTTMDIKILETVSSSVITIGTTACT